MSQTAASSKKIDPLRQQLDELDHLMQRMLALGVNQSPVDIVPDPEPEAVEFVEMGAEASSPAKVDTVMRQVEPVAAQQAEAPVSTDPSLESEIDLAFRAPTFVSIEAIAATSSAPLYADFQFASTVNELATEIQAQAPDDQLAVPVSEPSKSDPAPIADSQFAAPPSEPAKSDPAPVADFQFAIPPTEPTEKVPTLIPDFQFAPPPSELVTEELAAIPAATLTSTAAEPIIFVVWWLRPLALVNNIYDGSTRWLGPIGRGLRSRPMRNLLGICGLAALIGAAAWVLWEGTDWNS